MNYHILDLTQKDKWKNYLESLPVPQQDIYFTPEYYELYEQNGDGKACCFVFESGNELSLYPFLKNNIKTLGYDLSDEYYDIQGAYGYNGVISSTYDESFIKSFYKAFNEYCQGDNIIAEFTRFHPIMQNYKFAQLNMTIYLNRKTVLINLDRSLEHIQENYSGMCRRAIKKAIKSNVSVTSHSKNFNRKEFMNLYIKNMERVRAIPYLYFNEKYFNNLLKLKNIIQFCAHYNDNIIASTICMFSHDYFHYHLGASSADFQILRPNNILFDEMIKYAKNFGFKYMHLGGGITTKGNDSLFNFKSNFSRSYKNFHIGTKIYNKNIYDCIMQQWEKKFSEKKDTYKNMFLKYRM